MGNALHMAPWPRWAQVLCSRTLGHQDRNYSDGNLHYAYCLRCGYLFGNPWGDRFAVAAHAERKVRLASVDSQTERKP